MLCSRSFTTKRLWRARVAVDLRISAHARRCAASAAPPHRLLGVERDAPEAAVKAAFRRRALRCHPDVVPQEQREAAAEEFKKLEEAYASMLGRGSADCSADDEAAAAQAAAAYKAAKEALREERRAEAAGRDAKTRRKMAVLLSLPMLIVVVEIYRDYSGHFASWTGDAWWAGGTWRCDSCAFANSSFCRTCRSCGDGLHPGVIARRREVASSGLKWEP
eukprot:TRINITY_DN30158_c0_g2_i1.p1 TRINITY_DN30158_c0_g2~~TRINITY_DN30158_c0_g2_i1.p1  ORF type:complete len:220 (-),score=36.16 TRINITY_DN30158_c0_g2_i1:684-1343(-)